MSSVFFVYYIPKPAVWPVQMEKFINAMYNSRGIPGNEMSVDTDWKIFDRVHPGGEKMKMRTKMLFCLILSIAALMLLSCCTAGTQTESSMAESPPQEIASQISSDAADDPSSQESLSGMESSVPEESSGIPEQEERSVSGTVEDASMDTLLISTEDGASYLFEGTHGKVQASPSGLLIGSAVTVYYYGALNPDSQPQAVEIASIVVEDAQPPQEQEFSQEAASILAGMTMEEKVGQMFIARCPEQGAAEKAERYHLGGYLLFGRDFKGKTRDQVVQEIQEYQNVSEIPMLIGVDEEGGTVNRVSLNSNLRAEPFQSPQQLYQAGGFEAIRNDTEEKSQLLKSLGINVNFAPVCDVSQNPADFIYDRSFGQDAAQTSEYVRTVVKTMKGQGMGSVLKHFPGYGSNADTHTGIAYDNREYSTFTDSDFLPFEAGIEAGADIVLVSHNIVACMDSERPASLSPRVHEILREDLGFSGVIVTDDLAMDGVRDFADDSQAAVLAVLAGNDLLCCTDFETQIPAVLEAVKQGTIPEETIDGAVLRILELKLSLGI